MVFGNYQTSSSDVSSAFKMSSSDVSSAFKMSSSDSWNPAHDKKLIWYLGRKYLTFCMVGLVTNYFWKYGNS